MLTPRILTAGVLACAAAGAAAAASAVTLVPLAIRPGLWQMTVQSQTSGMPGIPPEALAHMTPQQKARIQAQMAAANGPHTFRQCVTAEELRKGWDWNRSRSSNERCTRTLVTSTASAMSMRLQCTGRNTSSTGSIQFAAVGPGAVHGNVDFRVTTSNRTMTVKSTMNGKWLGADCAGIKPGEMRDVTPR